MTVNLSAGTATGVASGIANIQNVLGSNYNDKLTGDAASNILVGNDGNDTINGGGGRNLIIGGRGADTLVGGPDGDLIIAGSTIYDKNTDNNLQALDAILAEWQRIDVAYKDRITNLRTGVGPGGKYNLVLKPDAKSNGTVVLDDHAADVLTGGTGGDWFWAKVPPYGEGKITRSTAR